MEVKYWGGGGGMYPPRDLQSCLQEYRHMNIDLFFAALS